MPPELGSLGLDPGFWFSPATPFFGVEREAESACWCHLGQGHIRMKPQTGTHREVCVFRLQVVCNVLDTLHCLRQGW